MQKHIDFSSIDDLLESGGFHAETNEEFEIIPEDQLDAHISKTTSFDSWEELFDAAIEQYITAQLGF